LKKAFADLIPQEIVNRKKARLLRCPRPRWFRGKLFGYAHELAAVGGRPRERGLFDSSSVVQALLETPPRR